MPLILNFSFRYTTKFQTKQNNNNNNLKKKRSVQNFMILSSRFKNQEKISSVESLLPICKIELAPKSISCQTSQMAQMHKPMASSTQTL